MSLSIPEFPVFREPELSDCEEFHELAHSVQPLVSELTFTNIYVWRKHYNFRLTKLNGNICILAQRNGESPFFLPILGDNDIPDTVRKLRTHARDNDYQPLFSRVPENQASEIAGVLSGTQMMEDRDNADYIYLSSDLADLPGRKYHKKKNHISRFRELHSFEYQRLRKDMVQEAKELQCEWCSVRGCFTPEHTSLAMEHEAIIETLDNLDDLSVIGGAVSIDGRLVGFTLGEPLNDDTFVIHFEKAVQEYQGLYQVLNQQFCMDICRPYTYVNREQDLGEPGLRQAKGSYHPHHLLMKYTVRVPRDEG